MSGRLDRVQVAVGRGAVTIRWDSREALLTQLHDVPELQAIVAAFRAVGGVPPGVDPGGEDRPAHRAGCVVGPGREAAGGASTTCGTRCSTNFTARAETEAGRAPVRCLSPGIDGAGAALQRWAVRPICLSKTF
jgi:hypothetical protein